MNTAFLAAANRLMVGLSGPVHVKAPQFDKAVPGAWLVDLSGIDIDARLPSPFTPGGNRPTGPAWYATRAALIGHGQRDLPLLIGAALLAAVAAGLLPHRRSTLAWTG